MNFKDRHVVVVNVESHRIYDINLDLDASMSGTSRISTLKTVALCSGPF